jgi:TonB family protein
MSPEPRSVSEASPKDSLGSLSGCLVDGDAEQRTRARRVKRRALAISILLQSAVLTLLVLVPLFGKTERITAKEWIPIPPYGHPSNHQRGTTKTTTSRRPNPDKKFTFHPPTNSVNQHPVADDSPIGPSVEYDPNGNNRNDGPNCPGCVDIGLRDSGPRPPQPLVEPPPRKRIVMTQLDPAMLIRRVEPRYPPLAVQTHREGRVELRAIIGTDGKIQSLQVVSGDPLFLLSAREAVQQWLYKPTYLNGQAVEIDTFITVVYTMQH